MAARKKALPTTPPINLKPCTNNGAVLVISFSVYNPTLLIPVAEAMLQLTVFKMTTTSHQIENALGKDQFHRVRHFSTGNYQRIKT